MNRRVMANEMDVVILCGGKGERLRSILNDRPKPMAVFNQQPFLSIIMGYLAGFGFRRFILSIGYLAEVIKKYYDAQSMPWEIILSEEKEPLGTGGALNLAKQLIKSDTFLAINGDSLCKVDLNRFINFHSRKKALLSMVLVKGANKENCGKINLDEVGRIKSFEEKLDSEARYWLNAGIYLTNKEVFSFFGKRKKFSLEYDFFPQIIKQKKCYGFKQDIDLIDIGTPEEYRKARNLLSRASLI